jgi:PKHD-type hydroxylase
MSAIVLPQVLGREGAAQIRAALATGTFASGKATAVGRAVAIKDNLILQPNTPAFQRALGVLVASLNAHTGFQIATWPSAMIQPMFCRYGVGQRYGDHLDAAIMGEAPDQLRCDVSVTVCLSDASEYDGGELVIDTAGVPGTWKGNAGDAIVYPSDTLHRVTEVTRGTRDVAITWIQSMVPDARRRRILFDLRSALDALDAAPEPGPTAEAVRRCYLNLVRMWT